MADLNGILQSLFDSTNNALRVSSSSSASGGTPALVFSTTNAAGNSSTFLRDNDQLALFDATAPTTQAFGDAAAVGSAAFAARRDHKHAMMANPVPQGAWTSYTPTWTTTGTAPAIGNGTLTGAYQTYGKLVVCRISLTAGSTTTFGSGNWRFALPVTQVTEQGGGGGVMAWHSANGFGSIGIPWVGNISGQLNIYSPGAADFTATVPFTWATNDRFQASLHYESV